MTIDSYRSLLRIFMALWLSLSIGCTNSTPKRSPASSVSEISGNKYERIARISALIAKHKTPPTKIIDAYFLEEQIGDGWLGPSDFRSFSTIEVAPQDLRQWTKRLTPLSNKVEYVSPLQHRAWWIAKNAVAKLQFYEPLPLTGRIHGWVGVSPQTGRIYIFTFTS